MKNLMHSIVVSWGVIVAVLPAKAYNRTVVLPNGDRVDVFDEAGTWTWTPSQDVSNARLLVVGGGGSGGSNAGGGGAGGQVVYLRNKNFEKGVSYSLTIGQGGESKSQWTAGDNGGDTIFGDITAKGGGAGSSSGGMAKGKSGANSGGSNGGGVQTTVTGTNDPVNGWYGGHLGGAGCNFGCGGGGGGAMGNGQDGGYVGADSKDADGGAGGDGYPCDITGTTVYYACGGGGGSKGKTPGGGGSGADSTGGIGGYKNDTPAGSGVDGTGSGGGGGGCTTSGKGISGAGGTGTVIIRYSSATPWAEVSSYEGLIDGEPHNVTVLPAFTPDGTTIAYSADDGATWQSDFGRTVRGVSTVKVRLSAPGYQDFVATATVTLKDAEDDNDGTRFFVVPANTPSHVAEAPFGRWSTAATNIQDAVDAASRVSGAQIFVQSGFYPVSSTLMLTNVNLTVRSWKKDVGTLDSEGTVIDAGYPTRVLRAIWMKSASIVGLTIANGYGDGESGGGIYFDSGRNSEWSYDFENCIFSNNFSNLKGGAVYAKSSVRFRMCRFLQNKVRGANSAGGAINCSASTLFDGCVFCGNEAEGEWACGGVIRGDSALSCLDCVFEDNAMNAGGAVYGSGALINYTSGGVSFVVSNCCFRSNTRVGTRVRGLISGGPLGSGLSQIVDSSFTDNSWGEGIVGPTELFLKRCSFSRNSSPMVGDGRVVARNCLFVDSEAVCRVKPDVPADSLCRYENCTFVRSKFAETYSGMNGVVVINCAFSGNSSDYSVYAGNGLPLFVTNCVTTVSGIETMGPGNSVVESLRFSNPALGDYSIRRSSPCRDAAVPLPWMDDSSTDLAGNPRVMRNGVPRSSDPLAMPDVGCYENIQKPYGLMLILR